MKNNQQQKLLTWLTRHFDPTKYDNAYNLNVHGWVHALEDRRYAIERLDSSYGKYFPEPRHTGNLETWIDALLKAPLPVDQLNQRPPYAVNGSSVNSLSPIDVYFLLDDFNSKGFKKARSLCQKADTTTPDQDFRTISLEKLTRQEINYIFQPFDRLKGKVTGRDSAMIGLTVDTSSSDEKIIADFTDWLKQIRMVSPYKAPRKRFEVKDFRRWSDNRVLGFLDLHILALHFGTRFPNDYQLGQKLFPEKRFKFDRGEKIRKTVAPLAFEMISRDFLYALTGISEEDAERKIRESIPE